MPRLRPPTLILLALALAGLTLAGTAAAQAPPAAPVGSSTAFDPLAATNAYLASVAGPERARSDAYFEGGYWLLLWDFLLGLAVNLALLTSGLSRRLRDLAERWAPWRPAQVFLYFALYLLLVSAVLFPMTVYEGFWREHAYGLSNQDFGAWLRDQAVSLGVGLLLGGLLVTGVYAVVRRLPRSWPLWGAVTAVAFLVFGVLIGPVYVAPLFNDYSRLSEPVARERILGLARAQGVAAGDVWVFDASRQSKRVSANVSGLASTLRISLNDNLLERCSLAEIEAVMGHEIGHYVLNHVHKTLLFFGLVIVTGFALLRRGFAWVAARRGAAWGLRGEADPAGLPLALSILSVYFFVLTPLLNTWIRVEEAEADLFGINASGQPDGEALVDLKLGEYRKLDPGPLEEVLFFDHPSGRSRIMMAMTWKAEHLAESEANARRAAADDARRGFEPDAAR